MALNAKSWGGHHLLPAIPIFSALYFLPPMISVPLALAGIFFAKELGEATQRAGGTGKAFKRWHDIKTADRPAGIWEHWDYRTPGIAGFVVAIAVWVST